MWMGFKHQPSAISSGFVHWTCLFNGIFMGRLSDTTNYWMGIYHLKWWEHGILIMNGIYIYMYNVKWYNQLKMVWIWLKMGCIFDWRLYFLYFLEGTSSSSSSSSSTTELWKHVFRGIHLPYGFAPKLYPNALWKSMEMLYGIHKR